jgi:peptidoglycan/xylan/chitin deacetylase (PgdA/CDA1 family)
MNIRETSIWFYRQLTARSRRRLLEQLREKRQVPVAVLFYHRVSDIQSTPWTIGVSQFKRHLDWLQKNFEIVSLEEAQRRIRSGINTQQTVAITFDDGYGENTITALPELVNRQIPASYFLSTNFLDSGQSFPHDIALGYHFPPHTWDELRQFVGTCIEFGGHTKSHGDVGQLSDADILYEELIGGIRRMEQELGTTCRYFAFPYGKPENTSQAAITLLHQHGILGVCSAYGALNWPGENGFHIKRFHGDPCLERLKNWLTLDQRHLVDYAELPFSEPQFSETELPSVTSSN